MGCCRCSRHRIRVNDDISRSVRKCWIESIYIKTWSTLFLILSRSRVSGYSPVMVAWRSYCCSVCGSKWEQKWCMGEILSLCNNTLIADMIFTPCNISRNPTCRSWRDHPEGLELSVWGLIDQLIVYGTGIFGLIASHGKTGSSRIQLFLWWVSGFDLHST